MKVADGDGGGMVFPDVTESFTTLSSYTPPFDSGGCVPCPGRGDPACCTFDPAWSRHLESVPVPDKPRRRSWWPRKRRRS